MRMRRKKHREDRLENCSEYIINDFSEYYGDIKSAFKCRAEKELHIEIGCGKGKFINELALKNPQIQSTVLMGNIGRSNASQAGIALPIEIAKRGVRKKSAIANMNLLIDQIRQEELNLKLDVMSAYFDVVYMKFMNMRINIKK